MSTEDNKDLVNRLNDYVPGLRGWAEMNNQNHVLAALEALDPGSLSYEVETLLETEEFGEEDPDELAEALVEMYANLRKPSEFGALDLKYGWGDNCADGWSLEDYVDAARTAGVPEAAIVEFEKEVEDE